MDAAERDEDLYRAYLGEKKADYYVPLFERFASGGSRVSWNWPAFFIAFFWMLYRKMYGSATLYFFVWPIVMILLSVLAQLVLGNTAGAVVYFLLALGIPFVVVPMFANALYYNHVKARIADVMERAPSHEAGIQRLARQGATNVGAAIGIGVFVCVFVTGILAAIAIPAYQDYTIRAQVSEGLMLADPIKAAITDVVTETQSLPENMESLPLQGAATQGKYVESVQVLDGAITIHYGAGANKLIAGRVLTLVPQAAENGSVNWLCGYAQYKTLTDIPPKYLPPACRPTS